MDISIVVPLFNEEESLPELESWIKKVMDREKYSYEVVFVDDGSNDNSWAVVESLIKKNSNIRGIRFGRNYGKSAALNTAFEIVQGDIVITMDADLQDSPEEIPEMRRMIIEDKLDLVSGWKKKRHDPLSKTIPTKLYNGVTRMVSGIKLHDFNCGLKAYKNSVVKSIEVYGEMHRYTPVLAKMSGYSKIGEKVVQHQARKYGKSKFGLERFLNGFLDLMTISFMGRFAKRPMHLFGALGVLFFMVGLGILFYLTLGKFFWNQGDMDSRPIFYFGILTLIVGSQLFLTGFLAELISRTAADRNAYLVSDRKGFSKDDRS